MSDGNESTCFSLPITNTTQIVADLHIIMELTENRTVVVEILMKHAECNNRITFYRTAPSGCGTRKKVVEEIGEVISAVPNSNKCYYRLSAECDNITNETCQFETHIAVTTSAEVTVEICHLHQGWCCSQFGSLDRSLKSKVLNSSGECTKYSLKISQVIHICLAQKGEHQT